MTPDFPELAAFRLGYGLSPLGPPPQRIEDVLASVADSTRPDGLTLTRAAAAQLELADARKAAADDPALADEVRAVNLRLRAERLGVLRLRIARAVAAPAGFGERLVQFWSGHFTVVAQNSPQHIMAGAFVDEAIRPHLNGRFGDMLVASSTHPMMLTYLNQTSSYGPNSTFVKKRPERRLGLNENLGREILELHSLGVGADYSQADVRQLAELLTGLSYNARDDRRFRPQIAEPGAETVLGKSYGGDGADGLDEIARALHDLATAPATAQHLARKLAVHFAADDPPQALVDDLAATWRDSGGDLGRVNAVLAGHPALAQTFRAKARQPMDFLISALRALSVDHDRILAMDIKETNRFLGAPLQTMGQPFARARGPNGWPEAAAAWITPQMLSERIGWALRIPSMLVDPLPDPRNFLATTLGDTASEALARAVPRAESIPEGVAIVLASTDFNRR